MNSNDLACGWPFVLENRIMAPLPDLTDVPPGPHRYMCSSLQSSGSVFQIYLLLLLLLLLAVLLVELTVPLEDRVAAGHTRKENRYAGLVQQCTENGWFARCFAVEVGCLGYVSPSLFHCLESLGIPSSTSRKLRNECSRVAHRCSYVLFLRRSCVDWTSWSMG